MKPVAYCFGDPESIVARRLVFDAEERRIKIELSTIAHKKKELHKECDHSSSMAKDGKVVFCQDCGYNSDG